MSQADGQIYLERSSAFDLRGCGAEYSTSLLRGYAALDARHRPEPPKVEQGHHVRFVCELGGALECRFDEV